MALYFLNGEFCMIMNKKDIELKQILLHFDFYYQIIWGLQKLIEFYCLYILGYIQNNS